MKIKILRTSAVLLLILFLSSVAVSAADTSLSPALDIISSDLVMVKSAKIGDTVAFSENDFNNTLGTVPTSITISSLPPESEGVLRLGTNSIKEGQTISAVNYDLLTFIPCDNSMGSSFYFSYCNSYTAECAIKFTETSNAAPEAADNEGIAVMTESDITCYGTLKGSDVDGDSLTYEITSYPTLGLISLNDSSVGTFSYTPYSEVTGVDSFSYRVRDEYGNYSDSSTVSVSINKRTFKETISDVEGHWSQGAVLSMVECGAMSVISENGNLYFDPDEFVTRAEYLKTVMKALGAPDLSDTATVFADDCDITDGFGGYINAAYKLGIVKGVDTDEGLKFYPNEKITRAEASCILNRILGAKSENNAQIFFDASAVPEWAASDLMALTSIGVISGTGGYIDSGLPVTRAQTAQMLYITKQLYS